MTHLIVQVGVQTRLLWLDNRYLHQITAVVTIFLMIYDLYLLLICHHWFIMLYQQCQVF